MIGRFFLGRRMFRRSFSIPYEESKMALSAVETIIEFLQPSTGVDQAVDISSNWQRFVHRGHGLANLNWDFLWETSSRLWRNVLTQAQEVFKTYFSIMLTVSPCQMTISPSTHCTRKRSLVRTRILQQYAQYCNSFLKVRFNLSIRVLFDPQSVLLE